MSKLVRRRRYFHINSCVNKHTGLSKKSFEFKSDAVKAAISLEKRIKVFVATYRCYYCGHYHIGKR